MYRLKIIVEGERACFTRPEFKVERFSYDVPTPGALEGLLKSVHWKPAIRYRIDKIVVFNPIEFASVRRNEVKTKVLQSKIKAKMEDPEKDICVYTCDNDIRSQRTTTILKNVRYGIEFHFDLTGLQSDRETNGEIKHYSILKRRLEKGQSFRTPCLGCSEFPVKSIRLVDEFDENEISPEIKRMGDVDLGYMPYHLEFEDKGVPINGDWDYPIFSDKADAVYYRPHMINGIIDVSKYKEDIKC